MHPKRLVFWIIWFAIITGFCVVYFFLGGRNSVQSDGFTMFRFLPFVMLIAAVALRFMFLPRMTSLPKALQFFVVGLSLAEGSDIMAMFLLSAADAQVYFTATVLVLLMYAPLFTNKLDPDAGTGAS